MDQRKILFVSQGSQSSQFWGHSSKIPSQITCQVEQAKHPNLPLGIIVNRCVVTVKARAGPIILINTTRQNIWIWQPLLATRVFIVDYHQIEHRANMERMGDNIDISFLPVAPNTIRVQLEQVEVTSSNITPSTSSEKPSFGPGPDMQATNFNFEAEVQCLPFKLNIGKEAKLTGIQQSMFIDLIYDHPEVFSLNDEDLRFCKWIQHTIPMTSDKPVYLPHCTIPPQLQGEVHNQLLGHHNVFMHPRW